MNLFRLLQTQKAQNFSLILKLLFLVTILNAYLSLLTNSLIFTLFQFSLTILAGLILSYHEFYGHFRYHLETILSLLIMVLILISWSLLLSIGFQLAEK